jgi:single-strand DNA-binding protein
MSETICGRLGLDPFLAYTKKGEAVCEMKVALQNEQNKTVWRKIVVFGKLAELCSVHLRKGNVVFARGSMILKKFINRDGLEKEYFELNAFSIGQSLL